MAPHDLKRKSSLIVLPAEPPCFYSSLPLQPLLPPVPLYSPWALVTLSIADSHTCYVILASMPLLSAVPSSWHTFFLLCIVNSFLAFKSQVISSSSRSLPWSSLPPPTNQQSSHHLLCAPMRICTYSCRSIFHPVMIFLNICFPLGQ